MSCWVRACYACWFLARNALTRSVFMFGTIEDTPNIIRTGCKNNPPPPIPTFCNISRQIPFSFQFSFSKIIILWFCLNSRWIRCLILVSRSREHPPAVLYTQKLRAHPISAKIHKSEAVYFLISNDVSGICSRYIILVWTHSKFTFTHVCKSTHVQICTRKQIFAVWMGLDNIVCVFKACNTWLLYISEPNLYNKGLEDMQLCQSKSCRSGTSALRVSVEGSDWMVHLYFYAPDRWSGILYLSCQWPCDIDFDLCARNSFFGLLCRQGHSVSQTHVFFNLIAVKHLIYVIRLTILCVFAFELLMVKHSNLAYTIHMRCLSPISQHRPWPLSTANARDHNSWNLMIG